MKYKIIPEIMADDDKIIDMLNDPRNYNFDHYLKWIDTYTACAEMNRLAFRLEMLYEMSFDPDDPTDLYDVELEINDINCIAIPAKDYDQYRRNLDIVRARFILENS